MQISQVAVVGPGTMGSGIAQWFCQNDIRVFLIGPDRSQVEAGCKKILASLEGLAAKGKLSPEQHARACAHLGGGLLDEIPKDTQLVIEAIFEDLPLKQKLFADLDALVSPGCHMATNTSSFLVRDVGAKLPLARRQRFLGLHFFNPATLMKLVEVVQGPDTDPALCEQWAAWFQARGKEAARCQDSPGFIVNRLARGFYGEALRIAEHDDFGQIDKVMREVGGFKMGPFELLDLIGVDVNLDVTRSVWNAFGQAPRFAPHKIQEEKVRLGHFGRKTGKGFYEYP